MIKKTLGSLLALSLITAPVTVFAAPGHGAHKEAKNHIKQEQNHINQEQKRVNVQMKQVVKEEAALTKQEAKLVKEQRKANPGRNQALQPIAQLEMKQAQDRKALLAAVMENNFDAAQTALAALKADHDQITTLRAQLKNGTPPAPTPVPVTPATDPTSGSQTPPSTGNMVTSVPTDNGITSTPVATTSTDSTSTSTTTTTTTQP